MRQIAGTFSFTPQMLAASLETRSDVSTGVVEALEKLPVNAAERIACALPDLWKLCEQLTPAPD